MPEFNGTYFEGFVGGGAAFFFLQPSRAVLVDNNPDLVVTYEVVKKHVDKLIDELLGHERAHRLYGADHYYTVRRERPTDAVERAARFIYLNRTCYNGLYRVNKSGAFNVPMGNYKNPRVVDRVGLLAASRALKRAVIRKADYGWVESKAKLGDFAFFDPPYDPLDGKHSFTSYTPSDFGSGDQENLRDLFARLADKGVQALVSNSDTPRIRQLYREWWVQDIPAARAINSNGAGRSRINELAITNFPPSPKAKLELFGLAQSLKHPGAPTP